MKVFSVIGLTKSGKTTTIENIIKELRKRNYTVGSVKEIHFEKFKMDVDGTNTHRHKMAGSQLVTDVYKRQMHETAEGGGHGICRQSDMVVPYFIKEP